MFDVQLTDGELLWIWRKRMRLEVGPAAKKLGVTQLVYIQAEANGSRFPGQPRPQPSEAEILRILRRRTPCHRDDLCREMGISHVKFLKMERRVAPEIVEFWKRRFEKKLTIP